MLRPCGNSTMVQLRTQPNMTIVTEFYSNYYGWNRVDDASVEVSGIPFFRTMWGQKETHSSNSRRSDCPRDLFRGEKRFWDMFTPKHVRHAFALYRSRLEPGLPRRRVWVNIAIDGQDFPDDVLRDYLNSGEPVDLDELFDFESPADDGSNEVPEFAEASRTVNGALLTVSRALGASRQVARMAQFKAEMVDQEIARLEGELERSCCHERESSEADIHRAYRRGRNEVAEMVRTRLERFSHEFGELQASHKALGEYRECRGTTGGMYLTTAHDYSYDVEYARQSRRMNERNMDFVIPQIKQRIWEQWDPIPISHDTMEVETGVPDEAGEVDQPALPDGNDQSFGVSMTGYFDLGD
ncbi:hypothetical protein Bca101_059574 [Brassica carinata]